MKSEKKQSAEEKQLELNKYKDLVIAAIDYYLDNRPMESNAADLVLKEHFQSIKKQTLEDFDKGRLTRLKQCFRDLTEMYIETRDFKINQYLTERTGYEVDLFQSYNLRVAKIIDRGKISTDNQFYDINMLVDHLCQNEPVDTDQIERLNNLLLEYELRKSKRSRPRDNG